MIESVLLSRAAGVRDRSGIGERHHMTVYFNKARGRWLYNFEHEGKRYSSYCLDAAGLPVTSRSAARMAEEVARSRVTNAIKIQPVIETTVAQVVASLIPSWQGTADWPNKRRYLGEVLDYFGRETAIASIDEAKAADLPAHLLKRPMRIWTGGSSRRKDDPDADDYWKPAAGKSRSPATVNLFLPVARMIFKRAHKMRDAQGRRLIEIIPEIKDLPVLKRKPRPVPDKVSIDIFTIAPPHLIDAMEATLFFGFRRGEIFTATIDQPDFELGGFWLDAARVKDKEDAFLPGSPAAMELLARLVEQAKARGVDRLITWQRYRKDPEDQAREPWRSVERPKRAWARIMKEINAKYGRTYRWHDLRGAFITQVAMTSGGVAAQALARHADFATTQAYIEVADEARREAANKAAMRPALAQSRKPESQTTPRPFTFTKLKLLK